jgi:hypothetical protein
MNAEAIITASNSIKNSVRFEAVMDTLNQVYPKTSKMGDFVYKTVTDNFATNVAAANAM